MPFKKKVPTIRVETKKMSECEFVNKKHCCREIIKLILLLLNTALLLGILCQQKGIEAMRVGGMQNYKMLQQVFKSEGFKTQQAQQIQQALQMYQAGTTAQPTNITPTQPTQ